MHCWKLNQKIRSDLVTHSGTPDCDCAELKCLYSFLCEWHLLTRDKPVETKLERRKLAVEWGWVTPWCKNYGALQEGKFRDLTAPASSSAVSFGAPTHTSSSLWAQSCIWAQDLPMALVKLHCMYAVPYLEHLGIFLMIWLSDFALLTHLVIGGLLADLGYCHQTCSALHGWDCAPALLPPLTPNLLSLVKTLLAPWNKHHYLLIWKEYAERGNTFYPGFSCILLIHWSECSE